jgi:uncharacterized protein
MPNKLFITRWNGWRRFLRDFAVAQFGFMLLALAIDMMLHAGLGTAPWVVLEKAISNHLPISLGQATITVSITLTLLDLVLGQPLGWGSLANMVCIGLWVDWLAPFVPTVPAKLWFQVPYLLMSTLISGLATAIYVGVNAGAGPRDSLMLAVARRTGLSAGLARALIEVSVVLLGWWLGGPVGLGTLIFAVAIGPAIQLAFRLLRVGSLEKVDVPLPASMAEEP